MRSFNFEMILYKYKFIIEILSNICYNKIATQLNTNFLHRGYYTYLVTSSFSCAEK